jgi:hypothetical protein
LWKKVRHEGQSCETGQEGYEEVVDPAAEPQKRVDHAPLLILLAKPN